MPDQSGDDLRQSQTYRLPDALWSLLQAFVREGRTGQIALNFHEGKLQTYDVREHHQARAEVVTETRYTT